MLIGNRAPWSARIERFGQGMAVSPGVRGTARTMFPSGGDFWRGPPRRREGGSVTASLGEQEDVRQMDRDGMPRARIAREPI